jgi:GTP cyclohydrolase I
MAEPRIYSGETAPSGDPIEPLVQRLLELVGEDPSREGLQGTPDRVARSLRFLLSGYTQDVDEVVNGACFSVDYEEMVLVKDIELYILCEHHLLPFYGRAHVAYIPNGKVLGLSKLARVVDVFARRLQIQERLTTEIANALQEVLGAHGVAVVIDAMHLCMIMRGVQKQHSAAVTSSITGVFRTDEKTRGEFLSLIGRQSLSS